jgi:hypothetical protein
MQDKIDECRNSLDVLTVILILDTNTGRNSWKLVELDESRAEPDPLVGTYVGFRAYHACRE